MKKVFVLSVLSTDVSNGEFRTFTDLFYKKKDAMKAMHKLVKAHKSVFKDSGREFSVDHSFPVGLSAEKAKNKEADEVVIYDDNGKTVILEILKMKIS